VLRAVEIENAVLADAALVMVNTSPDTLVQAYVGPAPVPPDDVTVTLSVVRFAEATQVEAVPVHK
jgi:hypothetical protein